MTDLDALREAALASPDDHSAKLVWLDAFQEQHGETPWVKATREFLAKCGERRKYKTELIWSKSHFDGSDVCDEERRRALPGWREWLGGDETWHYACGKHVDTDNESAFPMNWTRLVLNLDRFLYAFDRWRRLGSTIEVTRRSVRLGVSPMNVGQPLEAITHRARLTFAHGFLARAEFRDWRSADALLPAILADQPFVECGIRNAVSDYEGYAAISQSSVGPAFELMSVYDAKLDQFFFGTGVVFVFRPGPKNDALVYARRALSAALRKRALSPASAPAPVPG